MLPICEAENIQKLLDVIYFILPFWPLAKHISHEAYEEYESLPAC